jgi:hypothetical protein
MKSIFVTALALAATTVVAEEANTEAVEKALPRGGGGGFRGGVRGGGGFRGGRGGRGWGGRGWEGRGWRGGWGGPGWGGWLPEWGPVAFPWVLPVGAPAIVPVQVPIIAGESFDQYCDRVKRTRGGNPQNLTEE